MESVLCVVRLDRRQPTDPDAAGVAATAPVAAGGQGGECRVGVWDDKLGGGDAGRGRIPRGVEHEQVNPRPCTGALECANLCRSKNVKMEPT